MSPLPSSVAIAALNDRFRRTLIGGQVMLTDGIASLSEEQRSQILQQVVTFGSFTEDNDPHGEHDFGSIDHAGAGRIFWKIDYYDPTMTMGSEDPADPVKTRRVLTIMLASEY